MNCIYSNDVISTNLRLKFWHSLWRQKQDFKCNY